MPIKCKLGFHTWDGCICSQCGQTHDRKHDWTNDCEKCSKCGKTRNHHWYSEDCEICSVCGKTREKPHDWSKDCEKCTNCNKTRDKQHYWNGCKCTNCEKTRDEQHSWNGCICSKCGKEHHSWDGYKCSKCGKTIVDINVGMSYSEVVQLLGKPSAQDSGSELDSRLSGTAYGNQKYLTFNLPYGNFNIIINGNNVSKIYFYPKA